MEEVFNEKYIFDSLVDGEQIIFSKTINVYDLIDRIRKLNYVSPHKFFNNFLPNTLNESAVIVSIKIFFDGILKKASGDWISVDYEISNMQNMKELKLNFKINKFYNRNISFETMEERNEFIKKESPEAKITLFHMIKELTETLPFLELLEMMFEKTITNTFNAVVDLHLDKVNKKLKISLEELTTLILTQVWGKEAVVIKENLYLVYDNESDI